MPVLAVMPALFQFSLSMDQFLANMQRLGFFQFLLPFLLSLAIIYGVLRYAFKDKIEKSALGLIAIVLSFFVMLFAAGNSNIVSFLTNLSGGGVIIASGILMFVVFLGLIGTKPDELLKGENIKGFGWALIAAVILIALGLFSGSMGSVISFVPGISSDLLTVLLFIGLLAIAMWYLGKEEEEGEEQRPAGGRGRPG
ncbi:MAG: hypothetical protein HY519_04405 [Candidatus Aenigmarchaeota archaeon]|nr:hypothetical protein [Candidatus Aenigmarchaeota archaeon]